MRRRAFILFIGLSATLPLRAHVDLNHPLGGESFNPGDKVHIIWTEVVKHNTLNWDLFFSVDGGSTWNILKEDIPLEELDYLWIVPDHSTNQAKIRIIQDNEGEDYESTSQNFNITSITGIRNHLNSKEIAVWPNPVADFANIEFENPESGNHTLSIYNSQGIEALSLPHITSSKITVRIGHLPSGYYILQLIDDQQLIITGRLIIQ